MNNYKLCYIDNIDDWNTFELYFTDNIDDQWGDDWNDRPARDNAGEPYEDDSHHITSMIVRFIGIGDIIFGGKTYSVEDLNKGIACWLVFNNILFEAGLTLEEIKNRINEYNKNNDNDIQIFIREMNN